jgi:ABC-type phosphate transport system substrate-binding protein
MNKVKQGLRKFGAITAVVLAGTVALMGVGGARASVASAACVPIGENMAIAGSGSTLQREGQARWTSGTHFGTECPNTPVTYTATSSSEGLIAFGFTSSAIAHKTAFVGTDAAPHPQQIVNAERVSETKPLVIPVAETAIAVVINPPGSNTECKLATGTHGISYVQLTQIFGGKELKTWKQLEEGGVVEGAKCTGEITRVVPGEGSGTTYQFKNYLATLQASFGGKPLPCSLPGAEENAFGEVIAEPSTTNWKNMRLIGTGERPNILWPEPAEPVEGKVGNCTEASRLVRRVGDASVSEYVAGTNGTIGFAALPDAEAEGAEVAQLQDATPTVRYAGPVKPSTTESNCSERAYEVPVGGREGEAAEGVNWSQVFGAKPNVGNGEYPLCALTYDLAWKSYASADYMKGTILAKNVKSFQEYIVSANGQSVLREHYYQALPIGSVAFNVLAAAKQAIAKIG